MTPEYHYETVVNLATDMARTTTRDRVLNGATWLPFQLLYVELAKRKEITELRDLDQGTKVKYWTEVCEAQPEARRWKKIVLFQSLYTFDLITQKSEI